MPVPIARLFRRKTSLLAVVIFAGLLFVAFPQTAPSGLASYLQTGVPRVKRVLKYEDNGLANGWEIGQRKHPIEELMERGKSRWENLLSRQSKTLEEAVDNYRFRYGRNPPKGFDKWFNWAKENDVKILDDYDQINEDIRYFWAFSPADFRELAAVHETEGHAFTIRLDKDGESYADGKLVNFRADNLLDLLEPLVPYLPASINFSSTAHDMGAALPGVDQKAFLLEKISAGEYVTKEDLKPYEWGQRHAAAGVPGIASACSPDSPAWLQALEVTESGGVPKAPRPEYTPTDWEHPNLIHDHRPTFDFCYHPDLLKFHGQLSGGGSKTPVFSPMFQNSKLYGCGQIVATPLDYYSNASSHGGNNQYLSWDEKTIAKLHWRGKSTGDVYSHRDDYNWKNSHRVRLHRLTHAEEGTRDIYVKSRRTGTWEMQTWEAGKVNKAYTDVGLTDGPMQCVKDDGTCDEMMEKIDWSPRVQPVDAAKFKYVIDVDGNGWSSRFHRLLASESVVFKSTIFPEHFTDWLIPWYHYVPIQPSYSELYLALSFFIGTPGSASTGNDDAAREIAENGRKFALDYWRWEDMQSYMFRLLLEYIRLTRDDRATWEYSG